MAFLFTLLFVVTAYVTPPTLFGEFAPYHVEIILAVLAMLASIPNIASSGVFKQPQTLAMALFCLAVPASLASGGLISGSASGFYGFLPTAFAFLLAAINFRTKRHLRLAVLAMFAGSMYFTVRGVQDFYNNVIPSTFLYGDGILRRLRGLGFVYDPNDFAQVMVSLIPLVFLWKSKNGLLNIFLVGLPVLALATGMYYTHSRGGAVALMVIIVISLRRRIGTVPAAVLAGALFASSLAFGWSGGRDVSMEAGSDRLDAWSTGLELIKSHPLFGVGANRFADFNNITAHNTIIVCAAEIGLPGFVCWVMVIFSSMRSGLSLISEGKEATEDATEGGVKLPEKAPLQRWNPRNSHAARAVVTPFGARMAVAGSSMPMHVPAGRVAGRPPRSAITEPIVPDAGKSTEIRWMAQLLITSLAGFLTAGWFLSRALSMWLFFYCGIMISLLRMARDAGMHPRRDSLGFLARWSIAIAVLLLLVVYVILRVRTITGR